MTIEILGHTIELRDDGIVYLNDIATSVPATPTDAFNLSQSLREDGPWRRANPETDVGKIARFWDGTRTGYYDTTEPYGGTKTVHVDSEGVTWENAEVLDNG